VPRGIYKRTEEHMRNMSLALKGRKISKETRRKVSLAKLGKPSLLKGRPSPMRGKHQYEGFGEKMSLILKGRKGKPHSKERKQNIRLAFQKLWQNSNYRERQLSAIFKSLAIHPNKPETVLLNLLQQLYPNEWKFVGNGSKLIGGKSPDFINERGKKIVEHYGDYFHKDETDSGRARKRHFKKFGFDTLIIWEHELQNLDSIAKKIENFGGLNA
jgi:very-short-patch-repair endonuclease